jgi:hypothetical protein
VDAIKFDQRVASVYFVLLATLLQEKAKQINPPCIILNPPPQINNSANKRRAKSNKFKESIIMSNMNQLATIDASLLTELTVAEGEQASGGFGYYTLGNKSGITVNYFLNGKQRSLAPDESYTSFFFKDPLIQYDRKIGPGYEATYQYLSPNAQNFDRQGNYLLLAGDANLAPA